MTQNFVQLSQPYQKLWQKNRPKIAVFEPVRRDEIFKG